MLSKRFMMLWKRVQQAGGLRGLTDAELSEWCEHLDAELNAGAHLQARKQWRRLLAEADEEVERRQ